MKEKKGKKKKKKVEFELVSSKREKKKL